MKDRTEQFLKHVVSHPHGTTAGDVEDDVLILQVPNKQVARLLQRGLAADRADRKRRARRRAQRQSRRRNRSSS